MLLKIGCAERRPGCLIARLLLWLLRWDGSAWPLALLLQELDHNCEQALNECGGSLQKLGRDGELIRNCPFIGLELPH